MLLSNMCMLKYGHGWAGEFRGALGVAEGLSMMCLCHMSTAFLGTNTQPHCEAFECCQGKPIRDSVGTKVRLNFLGFFVFCFLFFVFCFFLVWHIQKPETGHCFVFLVLGKKNKNHQFVCCFVRTDKSNLPLNISIPLVGGPSAHHCFWFASVLYQLYLCCALQNKGSRVSAFRQFNVNTNCHRQTRRDYAMITDHTYIGGYGL